MGIGEGNLADILAPAIAKQQETEAKEERQGLLDRRWVPGC